MAESTRTTLRLAVVTGDHRAPDPTKLGSAWGPQDLEGHTAMVRALEGLGRFEVRVCSDHDVLFDVLEADPPDLVLNFCDTGIRNRPRRELNLPAWLELHEIPYTGATPQAMVLCFDKQVVRLAAGTLGVEIPREVYLRSAEGFGDLPDLYPALLKPNAADGSVGITSDAVVHDPEEARRYLDFLGRELPGRDVLWQEYLPGPEFSLGLIGNPGAGFTVLPPLEVDFSRLPEGLNPILSFESKADPASPYWTDIGFRKAQLAADVSARLERWSTMLFERFGLQDYARIDFRCAADGRPKLLEVNPNPAWATDAKLAIMAGFADISYPRMLEMIADASLARLAETPGATASR